MPHMIVRRLPSSLRQHTWQCCRYFLFTHKRFTQWKLYLPSANEMCVPRGLVSRQLFCSSFFSLSISIFFSPKRKTVIEFESLAWQKYILVHSKMPLHRIFKPFYSCSYVNSRILSFHVTLGCCINKWTRILSQLCGSWNVNSGNRRLCLGVHYNFDYFSWKTKKMLICRRCRTSSTGSSLFTGMTNR